MNWQAREIEIVDIENQLVLYICHEQKGVPLLEKIKHIETYRDCLGRDERETER